MPTPLYDGGIGLLAVTNTEVDTIQVEHTPMLWQLSLPPLLKLVGEALVESTDRAGTWRDSQQRLSHFSHLVRTRARHEHLREPFGDIWFIATVAFKGLGVELTFPISRYFEILNASRRCRQITGVLPIAIAFAVRTALTPGSPNERI